MIVDTRTSLPSLMYTRVPGGPRQNERSDVIHPLTMGGYRAKSDTVRRHKPLLPLLNPTSHSAFKYAISISDTHLVSNNWYWGRITGETHVEGPVTSGPIGDFGFAPFLSGTGIRSQTDCMAALKNKALLELSAQKLDVLSTLAEAKETVGWLGSRVETLAHGLRAVKKGRLGDFVKAVNGRTPGPRPRWVKDIARYKPPRNPKPDPTLKSKFGGNAADRWLEYNYALMPVLYDVVGAAQVLADYMADLPDTTGYPLRVKSKEMFDISFSKPGGNGITSRVMTDWVGRVQWNGTLMFWYSVDQRALKKAAEFGLISGQFLWEIMPYSFVVDMVVPIGDFIEACSATLGCSFECGWELERLKGVSILDEITPRYSDMEVIKFGNGLASFTGHDRRVLYDFPAPQLYVRNPLSLRNGATISALLRTLI